MRIQTMRNNHSLFYLSMSVNPIQQHKSLVQVESTPESTRVRKYYEYLSGVSSGTDSNTSTIQERVRVQLLVRVPVRIE